MAEMTFSVFSKFQGTFDLETDGNVAYKILDMTVR